MDLSAEKPDEGTAEWVTIPSPVKEFEESSGQRLFLWAVAIVVLLIGAVVGGALLLRGGGKKTKPAVRPAAQASAPSRPSPAPAPPATVPVERLPSFVPESGKDPGYGKTHPGWERYRGTGVEFRLFHEQGRLKVVQVIALRGKTIPETQVTKIVKELTESGNRTVSSHANKGGYRREVGKVAGNGEIVIYRKGGGIRGVVITLG